MSKQQSKPANYSISTSQTKPCQSTWTHRKSGMSRTRAYCNQHIKSPAIDAIQDQHYGIVYDDGNQSGQKNLLAGAQIDWNLLCMTKPLHLRKPWAAFFSNLNLPLGLVFCTAQWITWGYETMLRYELRLHDLRNGNWNILRALAWDPLARQSP